LALAASVLVRLPSLLTTDFPLNDGGLFFDAVRGIEAHGLVLPRILPYNGLSIPFAYPPLGFYLGAVADRLTPLGLLGILRVLPFLFSALSVLAFFLVAREVLRSRFRALLATMVFAVVPHGFEWMIVGGGLTRAPGLFFGLIAVAAGLRLIYRRGRPLRAILATGIFAGLTALSHPEAAVFVALSLPLAWLVVDRSWVGLGRLIGAGVVAAAVSSPWWGLVLVRFGPGPLLGGAGTGPDPIGGVINILTFSMTNEPFFPLIAALGLAGLVLCVATRRFLLPVWFVALFVVDERAAQTFGMVPLSMMAALGLVDIVLARLDPGVEAISDAAAWPTTPASRSARLVLPAASALMLVSGLGAPLAGLSPLFALTPADQAAMSWMARNAPADASVVVVAGLPWQIDAYSEWFPTLTGRVSVATLQGFEWFGPSAYEQQHRIHDAFTLCAFQTASCLQRVATEFAVHFEYVYVPSDPPPSSVNPTLAGAGIGCCLALEASLRADPAYQVVYDGPGALVARTVAREGSAAKP
jgi:hypothetical protein